MQVSYIASAGIHVRGLLLTLGPLSMSLWGDLERVTSENGVFAGHSESDMLRLLEELHAKHNMRFLGDGSTPVNDTQARLFETSFRQDHQLSEEQFTAIVDIFDRSGVGDQWRSQGSIPHGHPRRTRPGGAGRPCFTADRRQCCGRSLRVRWISATLYERDNCRPAWNLVKDCKGAGGCGARYLYDRTVLPGRVGEEACSWHVFQPWVGGAVPPFHSSKSGTTTGS